MSMNVYEEYSSVNVRQSKGKSNSKTRAKKEKPPQSTKLRGRDQDSPDVRLSKTITWLLRHVAESEGLEMRADGYVKVSEIVRAPSNPFNSINIKQHPLARARETEGFWFELRKITKSRAE